MLLESHDKEHDLMEIMSQDICALTLCPSGAARAARSGQLPSLCGSLPFMCCASVGSVKKTAGHLMLAIDAW